jgi:hypothetical protein
MQKPLKPLRRLGNVKFSKAPKLSINAKPAPQSTSAVNHPELDLFKRTYVAERRLLLQMQKGDTATYFPAKSLEGSPATLEDKAKPNQWVKAYNDINALKIAKTPVHYVRILFRLLRVSSLSIPTVQQLTSGANVELIQEHLLNIVAFIQIEYLAAVRRTKLSVSVNAKTEPIHNAVLRSMLDERLQLTPLFKYCLLHNTSLNPNLSDQDRKKLEEVRDRFEEVAALEYTVFPDTYDSVWGKAIPDHFRSSAQAIVARIMKNDRYCFGDNHNVSGEKPNI